LDPGSCRSRCAARCLQLLLREPVVLLRQRPAGDRRGPAGPSVYHRPRGTGRRLGERAAPAARGRVLLPADRRGLAGRCLPAARGDLLGRREQAGLRRYGPGVIRYVARRLGQAAVVLWGAITLSFIIVQLTPGDPARWMVMGGEGAGAGAADDSQIAQIRREMGLDPRLVDQYVRYLWGGLSLDARGADSQQRQAVSAVIGANIGATVVLGVTSLVLMTVLGIAFALCSVLLPTRWLRSAFQAITVIGIAVPSFVMAILLLQVFSFRLGWFPAFGAGDFRSVLLHSLSSALTG